MKAFVEPILVTGATGFVGRAMVFELLRHGVSPAGIRLLVRDRERAMRRGLPAASLVPGDLADREALGRAARGVRLAIHIAGAIKALGARRFLEVNAAGTAALVDAVQRHGDRCRLVHVSSLAAAGPSVDGATSALPPHMCVPRSGYGESKRQAELAVVDSGLDWFIVRPPVVYGPDDAATRLLFRQALGPVVAVPWTRRPLSLIHVRDLVHALGLAARSPVIRRVVPVEGPNRLDTDELVHALAAACGRRPRILRVPTLAIWPAALTVDVWAALTRRPQLFGRDKLADLRAVGWIADPVPARETLDFVPRIWTSVGFAETARAEGFA